MLAEARAFLGQLFVGFQQLLVLRFEFFVGDVKFLRGGIDGGEIFFDQLPLLAVEFPRAQPLAQRRQPLLDLARGFVIDVAHDLGGSATTSMVRTTPQTPAEAAPSPVAGAQRTRHWKSRPRRLRALMVVSPSSVPDSAERMRGRKCSSGMPMSSSRKWLPTASSLRRPP